MTSLPQPARGVNEAKGLVDAIISARGGREVVAVLKPAGLGVKQRFTTGARPAEPGVRGVVAGFSQASRRRMLAKLSGLDWATGAIYLTTLTYHDDWGDWTAWKTDLRTWQKRLLRAYGPLLAGAIWRLEFQKRGAPHFHLALFWGERAPDLARFRQWVSKSWNEVAARGDLAHLAAGTQVIPARNTSGSQMQRLMMYLGKYLCKTGRLVDAETGEIMQTGRIWGIWGRLPTGAWAGYTMSEAAFVELTRRIRRWGRGSHYLSCITPKWAGFLVLGDGELLAQLLRGLDCEPWDQCA